MPVEVQMVLNIADIKVGYILLFVPFLLSWSITDFYLTVTGLNPFTKSQMGNRSSSNKAPGKYRTPPAPVVSIIPRRSRGALTNTDKYPVIPTTEIIRGIKRVLYSK